VSELASESMFQRELASESMFQRELASAGRRLRGRAMSTGTRDLGAARDRAVGLAQAAGRLQVERRSTVVVHAAKAHANDPVSDVDHASEELIVDGLRAAWPEDGVLAEEGSSATGESGWRWVIDPLDGTRNYLSAAGPWSVCLALQFEDVTHVAVVHDPAAGETFSAVRGGGVTLGADPIRTAATGRLDEALVGLSFNPVPEARRRMAGLLGRLLPAVGDIRRLPAALDLCYLAAGRRRHDLHGHQALGHRGRAADRRGGRSGAGRPRRRVACHGAGDRPGSVR